MNTDIMGRFIFPDYPHIKLFISKSTYKNLMRIYKDIFKIYKDSPQKLGEHCVYDYMINHIYGGAERHLQDNPKCVYTFDFSYKKSSQLSGGINHLSLNFALFTNLIQTSTTFQDIEYESESFWTFTIVECRFKKYQHTKDEFCTILTLRYIYSYYKDLPPKRRHIIFLNTYIYHGWENVFIETSTKLFVPNFIFCPLESYYKTNLSSSFLITQF